MDLSGGSDQWGSTNPNIGGGIPGNTTPPAFVPSSTYMANPMLGFSANNWSQSDDDIRRRSEGYTAQASRVGFSLNPLDYLAKLVKPVTDLGTGIVKNLSKNKVIGGAVDKTIHGFGIEHPTQEAYDASHPINYNPNAYDKNAPVTAPGGEQFDPNDPLNEMLKLKTAWARAGFNPYAQMEKSAGSIPKDEEDNSFMEQMKMFMVMIAAMKLFK